MSWFYPSLCSKCTTGAGSELAYFHIMSESKENLNMKTTQQEQNQNPPQSHHLFVSFVEKTKFKNKLWLCSGTEFGYFFRNTDFLIIGGACGGHFWREADLPFPHINVRKNSPKFPFVNRSTGDDFVQITVSQDSKDRISNLASFKLLPLLEEKPNKRVADISRGTMLSDMKLERGYSTLNNFHCGALVESCALWPLFFMLSQRSPDMKAPDSKKTAMVSLLSYFPKELPLYQSEPWRVIEIWKEVFTRYTIFSIRVHVQ